MYRYIKRFFDFTCALIGLVLSFPIIMITAILMALHFRSNPIFVQVRIGRQSKLFKIYKLKSMSDKKDLEGNLLPNEDRLTILGRWLRKSSLDELPQLLNVIKGDMSLIGPRPMGTNYLNILSVDQNRRHEVRPGVTGWAQVNGRDSVAPTKKFKLDVWYVDNRKFKLDLKILFKTIRTVLIKEGVDNRATDENFPENGSYNSNYSKSN